MIPAGIVLVLVEDTGDVATEAARRVSHFLRDALATKDLASIVLAGAGTASRFHLALARPGHAAAVDWQRVHVFFGDERAVRPDDPESNYGAARRDLLEPLGIPASHVHRMTGEIDPERAALAYDRELAAWLERHGTLDVVLLGVGEDGHTASLFPGAAALAETERLCAATRSPVPPHDRITLTYPALARAEHILVLVDGEAKRAAVARSLVVDAAQPTPAALARSASGTATWIVDRAASGR